MFYAIVFLASYAATLTVGCVIAHYRTLVQACKDAEQNLALAGECLQDVENEKAEFAAGYSLLATALEEHQTEIEALAAHTEEHCRQINELSHIRIRIVPLSEAEEEAYAESTSPTLPLPDIEWIKDAEGLDTL